MGINWQAGEILYTTKSSRTSWWDQPWKETTTKVIQLKTEQSFFYWPWLSAWRDAEDHLTIFTTMAHCWDSFIHCLNLWVYRSMWYYTWWWWWVVEFPKGRFLCVHTNFKVWKKPLPSPIEYLASDIFKPRQFKLNQLHKKTSML